MCHDHRHTGRGQWPVLEPIRQEATPQVLHLDPFVVQDTLDRVIEDLRRVEEGRMYSALLRRVSSSLSKGR